ncbi:MAG: hypothetical protein WCG15_06485 [Actinomycetes bacterium]
MTAIAARRRRRKIAAVVTSVLSVVALPSGVVLGANALLHESGGNSVDEAGVTEIPTTPVELIAVTKHVGEVVSVSSIALLALAPGGHGGTIVSIPVGAMAHVAADAAPARIADSFVTDGIFGLKSVVEDLLNISIDKADDVTALEFADLLQSVAPQQATLAQPVFDTSAAGVATVLEAGSASLTPAQISAGLAASQSGIPESGRLPQVKELWKAIARAGAPAAADSTGTSTTIPAITEAPVDTAGYLAGLLSGRVDVWQLSGTLITDAQRNPSNVDLYEIDGGEALMVMASVMPSALSLASDAISVMVDVPFASTTVAREAVIRLAYLGANVMLVRETTATPAEHTVVYYTDEIARTEGEAYSATLGTLEFKKAPQTIAGVNLQVVLGNNFVAFLGSGGTTTTIPEKK